MNITPEHGALSDEGGHGPDHDTFSQRRAMLAGLGGLAAGAFMARSAQAGPLNPPPGPIQSTPGPEPRIAVNETNTPGGPDSLFRITEPGSYYLTDNITGVVGKHGIEIASSGVTLDLNGFDLAGVPDMGAFDGITTVVPDLTDIEVRNGSVRNWGDGGVDLASFPALNCRIERIRSSGNGGRGINAGFGSTVSSCTVYRNSSVGIFTNSGSTVSGCTAYENTGEGIRSGIGITLSGCTVHENSQNGIFVGPGSTVSGCTAYDNDGGGIQAGFGCTVSGCTARSNSGNGITTGPANTVTGCTASGNEGNGLSATRESVIVGNTCDSNGLGNIAGIRVTGSASRIEGNHCTDSDRGIEVTNGGNIIIKNTCAGNNTNWDVAAGNVCLVVNAATAVAILGDSGGTSPGSSNPNANYTF